MRAHATRLLVAGVVCWVAFDGGSFGVVSRSSLAILAWWCLALAVGLGLWPRAPVPRAALVIGGLLAAFAAFAGLSALWADSAEDAVAELNRTMLYLAVYALAVLGGSRANVRGVGAGIALGITAVGLAALGSRLFPSVAADDPLVGSLQSAQNRLSYPLNYWNGLATLLAVALPLLVWLATTTRHPLLRGLALAPIPALAGAIYLTSSRGGALVAVVGVIAFVVLTSTRLAAALAVVIAAAGSAAAVAVLAVRPEIAEPPPGQARAADAAAAALIALACLGSGALQLFVSRFSLRAPALGRGPRRILLGGLALLLVAGIVLADPAERFERFRERPQGLERASVSEHLLSGSGRGRWQLWEAAVDEFRSAPVVGRGAGSYEAWWAEHGTLSDFVRDAHSLYLETLGELGAVGLLLLLAVFGSALATALARLRRGDGATRPATAAFVAAFLAFALEAGVDWMWETTAVAVIAFVCLGLLTGPATLTEPMQSSWPRARLLRVGFAALAVAAIAVQAVPLLAELRLRQSYDAVARGDAVAALAHAEAARRLEPWASSPYLQLALVEEQVGDLAGARSSIRDAIARDGSDWRLHLVAARIQTKSGAVAAARVSLARARELNPRSPVFTRRG